MADGAGGVGIWDYRHQSRLSGLVGVGDIRNVRYAATMDKTKAIEIVKACLANIGEPGFTYAIAGVRDHPEIRAIAVQPTRPDGQPLYDIMGFDVDKATGEVHQMS